MSMAIVTFDTKDFKAIDSSRQRLVEIATALGIEIEVSDESEIKMNINPNRPDLLDFVGVSRAMESFAGKKKPRDKFYKISNKPYLDVAVDPRVTKVRPYFAGIVVKNADLSGNRLKYLINFTEKFSDTYGRRRKKIAIGLHALNAIKGGLVYSASEEGKLVPLGKRRNMQFRDVMEQHDKGITYQDAVPNYGSKKVLYPFLRDSEKVLALIPITNCEQTRVTEKTKDIFIDITGTSASAIKSVASVIASSFLYAGADIYPITVRYTSGIQNTPRLDYREMKLSMKLADAAIGVETGRHNVITLANKMGYTAAKYGASVLFYIPPYRVDVLNEQDIIEDVAIAYGYDRIVPAPVSGTFAGLSNDAADLENKIATLSVGLGYTEAINSMLTSEGVNFKSMQQRPMKESYVGIADSKTSAITMLRTSVLPSLMQNLAASASATMPQRLFEIGRTFSLKGKDVKEEVRLGLVSVHSRANFAEMKSIVSTLLQNMGQEFTIEPQSDPSFIEGRCAKVLVEKRAVAAFGEIHPQVLKNFGIEEPVVAAELLLY